MIQIAILGFGVVGSGTAEVLTENRALIAARCGEEVNIRYILDLRDFPEHPLGNRVVHDINVILRDPEVSVVAEMMGGSHPAYDFSRAALEAGKSVVTSNKEVVATYGAELLELARSKGVSYLFEASVGGGIPIIRPLQNDLACNEILSISGILNNNFEQFWALQNSINLSKSEVLATYMYKMGLSQRRYSYSSALGLFNSLISFVLLLASNFISKKISGKGLY